MANRVILLVEAGIEGQMPTELAKSNVEVVSGPDLLTELRDLCQDPEVYQTTIFVHHEVLREHLILVPAITHLAGHCTVRGGKHSFVVVTYGIPPGNFFCWCPFCPNRKECQYHVYTEVEGDSPLLTALAIEKIRV